MRTTGTTTDADGDKRQALFKSVWWRWTRNEELQHMKIKTILTTMAMKAPTKPAMRSLTRSCHVFVWSLLLAVVVALGRKVICHHTTSHRLMRHCCKYTKEEICHNATLNNYCTQVAPKILLTTAIKSSVKSRNSETPYRQIFVHLYLSQSGL